MLLQEWNWDDAKAVWQKEAEERADHKWQSVMAEKDDKLADKDAELADKDAKLADKDVLIAELMTQLKKYQ